MIAHSEARRDLVRSNDPDRYLSALTAAPSLRDDLIALYAFANEIARVREVVSDPGVGAIRLQWWRDTLSNSEDVGALGDPIVDGVRTLLNGGQVSSRILEEMIESREQDLDDPVINSWDDLDAFCDRTSGLTIKAALALAGANNDDLAVNAGRCWGLIGLVRAFPFHAGQGRVYMPAEAFEDADLDPHAVFQGHEPQKAFAILYGAAARAADYLELARPQIKSLKKEQRAAVSYVAFYDLYARQLRSRPGEAYLIHPEIPAFRKQMKLMIGGLA